MVHPAFLLRAVGQATSQYPYNLPPQRSRPLRWHPKITPYRLVILTTTIGLGTAKSVVTQRGSPLLPVTLEWFTATVLFLLLFSVSSYDCGEVAPPSLSWLFKPDCMNTVWRVLEAFSVPRPSYMSEEKAAIAVGPGDRPPITLYRILVCCTVASLGMSKAVLGYYGLSTAVTWTDWALAVPITTFLYLLGLYEYNSLKALSGLFAVDRSNLLYSLNVGIKRTVGVLLALGWTYWCFYALWYITYEPTWDFRTLRPDDHRISLRTRIEDGYDFALKLVMQEFLLVAIVGGIAGLLVLSQQIVQDVTARDGWVRTVLRVLHRPVMQLVEVVLRRTHGGPLQTRRRFSSYGKAEFLTSMRMAFRLLVHVVLHLFGVTFLLTFCMLAAGVMMTMIDLLQKNKDDAILPFGFIMMQIFLVSAISGIILSVARILLSLLSPLLSRILESRPFSDNSLLL
ncbi:hypothetical protein GALMADRAFT_283687 [Galerina marginata CBS 339.88]|uniref:Uncharacterized protein n=1 Tax=Galerina marginata (strain CBS 339.88) TaxID=685588 RepID=A0A067S898_GALM3|nr:hypothetical protein GALMADRAFT_283687 [Galerina marginata CBS 339.88]